ncbi:MAG: hypothetical protein ACKPKO_48800, partial [Candidatus Fonsibacter sp.]
DKELLQWQGDDKLQWFYTRCKLITTSLSVAIPEEVIRAKLHAKNRNTKQGCQPTSRNLTGCGRTIPGETLNG